ncbi:MAG: sigma-70 family RNA polymerase sigma factor [Chloroflexi bacterium]|nr:MAG: sigma-70 family RNA polymerase sigma factor [Chloroflexota bacterium]
MGLSVTTQALSSPALLSSGTDLRRAVKLAAAGNQAAFKELYQEYARPVYNLVFRCMRNGQVAEDVCQEVWVKAYRELHRLEEPQAFPAWLYRIAARACVDAARRNSRAPATTELREDSAPATGDDPEQSALQTERVRLTWEALAAIPARQHLALFLREMERRSYKEISQMLETSESAVETLLFRARHGFARAYERLDAAMQDRCQHAHRSMAAIIDGEATPVQQTAVRAHVGSCQSCSGELSRMQRAATAYAALISLPVPAMLGGRIFQSIGASSAGAGALPGGIAKFVALAGANAKICAVTLIATTAVTTAAIASPIGEPVRPWSQSEPSVERTSLESTSPTAGDPDQSAPTAGQHGAAAPAPGALPDATGIVDGIASTTLTTVSGTAADVTRTVDATLHEAQSTVNGAMPTSVPLNVDPGIVPLAPVVPPPLAVPPPTPALPTLP